MKRIKVKGYPRRYDASKLPKRDDRGRFKKKTKSSSSPASRPATPKPATPKRRRKSGGGQLSIL